MGGEQFPGESNALPSIPLTLPVVVVVVIVVIVVIVWGVGNYLHELVCLLSQQGLSGP